MSAFSLRILFPPTQATQKYVPIEKPLIWFNPLNLTAINQLNQDTVKLAAKPKQESEELFAFTPFVGTMAQGSSQQMEP